MHEHTHRGITRHKDVIVIRKTEWFSKLFEYSLRILNFANITSFAIGFRAMEPAQWIQIIHAHDLLITPISNSTIISGPLTFMPGVSERNRRWIWCIIESSQCNNSSPKIWFWFSRQCVPRWNDCEQWRTNWHELALCERMTVNKKKTKSVRHCQYCFPNKKSK